MDSAVLKSALGGMEKILSRAKRALREHTMATFKEDWDGLGSYEHPLEALAANLEELHEHLLVILEAAAMPETRVRLEVEWKTFTSAKDGLRTAIQFDDYEYFESPALIFLERQISALNMSVHGHLTGEEAWTLARLEEMLDDTPALLMRRDMKPSDEFDLQNVMHDYLSAAFSDFDPKPEIAGSLKKFKPDCGIISVGAAIEFKIAHTKQEAITRFSGIVEDTSGYKGSKAWYRFYAVMLVAKPFVMKSQLKRDMKRIGATTWTAILVNGDTEPKQKNGNTKKERSS